MSKWKERIPGIVISVILVAVFAVFMVILLQSKMVPTKLLILGGIALVLLVASAVLLVRSIRNKGQFICGASLSLVLALVLGLASNYISVATGTLTEIGAVRTEYTPVAVYVRTDDPASALEDTKGYTFGILESLWERLEPKLKRFRRQPDHGALWQRSDDEDVCRHHTAHRRPAQQRMRCDHPKYCIPRRCDGAR